MQGLQPLGERLGEPIYQELKRLIIKAEGRVGDTPIIFGKEIN